MGTKETRYLDPEEPLAGKCMTCKTAVGCLRRDAESKAPTYGAIVQELGRWSDLLSTGCPQCGARVFLMSALEFRKVVSPVSGNETG